MGRSPKTKPATKKPVAKSKTKTKPAVKTGNEIYRGEIEQDDKKNYWLQGGLMPVGRVLFPSLFSTKLSFNGKEKEQKGKPTGPEDREYSVTLLLKKNDPRLKSMEKKIEELASVALGVKKGQYFNTPIKDGDEKYKQDPVKYELFKGMKFVVLHRPGHLSAPVVLDEYGEEMLSKENFYPGCYAIANVSFKCYTTFGGGVTPYWAGIKKVADGEKIGFDMTKRVKGDFDKSDGEVSVDDDGNAVY